jgi:hypothetical protein
MATKEGNLSEVVVTFSDESTTAYAARCPAGEKLPQFLHHLVTELIAGVGHGRTFRHVDTEGTINFDRQQVESFVVTFSASPA